MPKIHSGIYTTLPIKWDPNLPLLLFCEILGERLHYCWLEGENAVET